MGDIKTVFDKAVYPDTSDLSGDLATSRGGDPLIDLNAGGGSGLKTFWEGNNGPIVSTPGGEETANSLSGLPKLPWRYEPPEEPPDPPTLEDRNPGTIDKK